MGALLSEGSFRWLDSHVNLEATAGKIDGLSLERMRHLAKLLGDPQLDYPVVHITGTNGKGSTAYLVSRLLASVGLRVGTNLSPHVSSLSERVQINCEPLALERIADLLDDVRLIEETAGIRPSWFEIMTAVALRCFSDDAVDVAVLEVGKLGRFDATNVADAAVAVVTNIGEDHTDGAQDWQQAVAWEKSGIVKPGCELVLGEVPSELITPFVESKPGDIQRMGEHFNCVRNDLAVGGRLLAIASRAEYEDVFLSLHGAHQGKNAALAVAATESFLGASLPAEAALSAFGDASLPGRMEAIGRSPLLLADGAHNPEGAAAARAALEEGFAGAGRRFLVIGMMRGKDPRKILKALAAQDFATIFATTAPSPRAIPAGELAKIAEEEGLQCEAREDVAEAVFAARDSAAECDVVFVTGSLYVVGAARDALLN